MESKPKLKLVDVDGTPITLEVKENPEFKETKSGLTYIQWVAGTKVLTPLAAWNYKQGEIECIMEEWNESVLYGKDKLKESIESITKLNNKLSGENKQLRKEMDELTRKGNNFL